jgi:hypothetical protein
MKHLDIEFYLWFLFPTLIGLFILIKSVQLSFKKRVVISWIFTILILLLICLSEIILYQNFFQGAWASFVPHFIIGFSTILFVLQLIFLRRKASHKG